MTQKQPIHKDTLPEDTSLEKDKELAQLQALLTEKEEITKKAQIDYINLKSDFEFLLRQTKIKEETLEQDTLIKVIKKLLPFVEDLRKSLLHLTEQQKAEPLGKGVQMVYEKFVKTLVEFSIFPIESIGLEPNALFHEPVGMQPASQEGEK
jgi:molecular chaperone GrpE